MFDRNFNYRKMIMGFKEKNIFLKFINICVFISLICIILANIYIWIIKPHIDKMYSSKYESILFYNLNKLYNDKMLKAFVDYDLEYILGGDLILKVKYLDYMNSDEERISYWLDTFAKEGWICVEKTSNFLVFKKLNLIARVEMKDNIVSVDLGAIDTEWGIFILKLNEIKI